MNDNPPNVRRGGRPRLGVMHVAFQLRPDDVRYLDELARECSSTRSNVLRLLIDRARKLNHAITKDVIA